MLTPARSKDLVVLNDSDEILPSKRKVLGVDSVLGFVLAVAPAVVELDAPLLAADLVFWSSFCSSILEDETDSEGEEVDDGVASAEYGSFVGAEVDE